MNSYIVEQIYQGMRLDQYISGKLNAYTRSFLQKLIKEGNVTVNNKSSKAGYKVCEGDVITVTIPEAVPLELLPEDIPLDILYEDEVLLVVNKPKGMVVHPACGHSSQTLVNALLYHCKGNLSGINGVLRPGIVHRIDRDTTGAILVCKSDEAHKHIANQLKEHTIHRRYEAIIHGVLAEEDGVICAPIGRHSTDRKKMAVNRKNGKEAITHYKVLQRFHNYTHIECRLETGRTHQIRVHMKSIQHPLLGDAVYGPAKSPFPLQGQCLHAKEIGFIHPSTGEYMQFEAKRPEYFEQLLHTLK